VIFPYGPMPDMTMFDSYSPNRFIQQCPYCHVIHETATDREEWCEDHKEQKGEQCPGCPKCSEVP
jgi:hypothetical protein